VHSQLRIFTLVGTGSAGGDREGRVTGPIPTENMWWLQTPKPKKPMVMPE
jgi:hypothetical protein